MRVICDACESAAAVVFCPADEAALCASCDEKVHMCNKLASRHLRLALANPGIVPKCELCDSAPAFFYCAVDGISVCLQCDMVVHVESKRTHARFLILRQRVLFPIDSLLDFPVPPPQPMNQAPEIGSGLNEPLKLMEEETQQNQSVSPVSVAGPSTVRSSRNGARMIDLNRKPRQPAKNKKK